LHAILQNLQQYRNSITKQTLSIINKSISERLPPPELYLASRNNLMNVFITR
jgi:hypothetical protein